MIPAANDSVYALTVHSRVDTLPPRSWWMDGRAVITTRASSATMKKAAEVSSSAQPRDDPGQESLMSVLRRPGGGTCGARRPPGSPDLRRREPGFDSYPGVSPPGSGPAA